MGGPSRYEYEEINLSKAVQSTTEVNQSLESLVLLDLEVFQGPVASCRNLASPCLNDLLFKKSGGTYNMAVALRTWHIHHLLGCLSSQAVVCLTCGVLTCTGL